MFGCDTRTSLMTRILCARRPMVSESIREHAEATMAALNRLNLVLDDFVGLNWSSWTDRVNVLISEGSYLEECSKNREGTETVTLGTEDMSTYGHCPAHDDFFLVVCNSCGQVVKPQAFEKHCERRHGLISKFCSQSPHRPAPRQHSQLAPPTSYTATSKESLEREAFTASPQPAHKPTKAQKRLRLPSVGRSSQETPFSPHHTLRHLPQVPLWPTGPLPPGGPTSSWEEPALPKTMAGTVQQNEDTAKPQDIQGPRTYKKVYKKVCDLDKHCGVCDPGMKKRCTRQLMCNIHSIHQRRQVAGRSKTFDQLVADLKKGVYTGLKASEDQSDPSVSRDPSLPEEIPTHTEAPQDQPGPQLTSRTTLSSICNNLRFEELSESKPEEEQMHADMEERATVEEQEEPNPFRQSLLYTGEESEGEEEQEKMEEDEDGRELPATPWHPKPLGLCAFGSRTLGCSVFTFDRRLHRLRFALNAMVEQHISAHLRKKLPQVTSGLQSHQAASTNSQGFGGSSGHVGNPVAIQNLPPASLRVSPLPLRVTGRENCSSSITTFSGQSDNKSQSTIVKSSLHQPPMTKSSLTTPNQPRPLLERPRNPVGRPCKARIRELELSNAAGSESPGPPREKQSSSAPRHIRRHPQPTLRGRGRTRPGHSSQRPINRALLLLEKKPGSSEPLPSQKYPRLPAPPSLRPHALPARGRGRPLSVHRRAGIYEHSGLARAKKRKTSSGSSSSSPLPQQRRCSSPRTHPVTAPSPCLFSWRGEGVRGVVVRGLDKRMETHRVSSLEC
ncbi:hypothetical protein UPYG_G00005230 [Umbra pygmaea]|uniref:SCA7 domain-containing protein n=1 Tax=Umbra pygmaea TaxID=75934 RepID=A0ABD0XHA1_UMBPY